MLQQNKKLKTKGFAPERGSGKTVVCPVEENSPARGGTLETKRFLRRSEATTGFTLLEMLVALAVFTIAITLSLSALLSLTSSQKKAVALQNVYDNIRFAFEAMTKEIRTGYNYHCSNDLADTGAEPINCPFPDTSGGISLTFTNSEEHIVTYQIFDDSDAGIKRLRKKDASNSPDFYYLTAPEVEISQLKFYVFGADTNNQLPPRVLVVLDAEAVGSQNSAGSKINLETTVTQRTPEF